VITRAINNHTDQSSRQLEQKRTTLPIKRVTADGTFSGYASIFDQVDLGKDKVAKGAFRDSLKKRPMSSIRMLFQHDPTEPIGIWNRIVEDTRGLWVEGKIIQESTRGREVLSLLRAGAIDGLSIGFKTSKSHTNQRSGIRTITQADLWEISVVTFPMLPQARVEQVKSNPVSMVARKELPTIREFERWLTRDAGFTRSEAKTVIGKGFATLAGMQDATGVSNSSLLGSIQQATRTLNARRKHDQY